MFLKNNRCILSGTFFFQNDTVQHRQQQKIYKLDLFSLQQKGS